ncbi:PAS domain S-box protein [Lacinutrix himadriensis]|uniref:PAS domain S-box protein n=1 Tax=Lacinutrix himadriensis TaxID=641549 RepID=UPI0006E3E31C|nr:PAS domain S-box protein [Lacinutrix himadriensis]
MNIYTIILIEFLLISSSILLLFKFRNVLGLAPLYLFLGAVRYLQALSGDMIRFTVFDELIIYPTSVIIFSSLLFAVLLIYIKEGVASARALILGIIISNLLLSALFGIMNLENLVEIDSSFAFLVDDKYFITGTVLLFLDFLCLVIIYQFLISILNKRYFFFTLFISLLVVFVFDAFIFKTILYLGSADFYNLLVGNIIGKFIAALVFSVILYIYLRYVDNEKSNTSFIANQERDVFSILRYEKRYLQLKTEKQELEKNLTSQLETSLNSISGGFISLDTNWCYTYVNKKAAELLGKSPESLIGKHIWTEFPEGVGRSFYEAYYKAVETQETIYFDDYYEPLDKWFENRIYPSPDGLIIYYTDISKQKKIDANNQMLLSLIETNDDFIGLATLEGEPIYLNDNGRQLMGLESDEKMPASISSFFPEDYRDRIANEHMPSIFESNKWQGETHFKNFKTGDLIPIEMSGFLIKDKVTNNPIALGVVAKDISRRKEAEEKLKYSEQLFKRLTSKAPAGIYQTDTDGSCNYVNERWLEYAGLSYEEAMGPGWAKAIHPDDEARILKEWEVYVLSGESELETDFRFLHKDNKVIWVSVKTVGTYDSQNNLYGYIGMAIDVTEKKKAEQKLINSEQLFKRLTSNAPVGIYQTDKEGICNYVNEEWMKYSGMTFEESLGFGWCNAIHPEDKDRIMGEWEQAISTGGGLVSDFRLLSKKGETKWVTTKATSLYNHNNELYGYIGTIVDVSEHKEAEEKLINSEQLFRRLSSNAPVGIFQTDKDGACNYVNQEWIKYSGIPLDEALGFGWSNAIHPEDKERVLDIWQKSISTGTEYRTDLRFLDPEGGITWLSAKATGLYDANNELYGYIGTLIDVTERKEAEDQVAKSEKYLENILNNIGDPVFVKDEQSRILLINNAFCSIFNIERESVIGKTLAESVSAQERESFLEIDKQVLVTGVESVNEETLTLVGKESRTISTKKTRFIDVAGNPFIIGIIRDVTERKKIDEEIRMTHQRLTTHLNNSPLAIIEWDKNFFVTNWSAQAEKIFGWKESEAIGKQLVDLNLVFEEDIPSVEAISNELSSGKVKSNKIINRNNTKTGEVIYCQWHNSVLQSSDGQLETVLSLIQDVTESKKADEEIRMAHQRLTTHLNNSPLAIIEWDKNLIIRSWSVKAEKIFGWKKEEVLGRHFSDLNLVYEEDFESTEVVSYELMNGIVKSNKIINRNNTKNGNVIYCQWYNSVLQSPDGEIETVLSLVQDVTKRKEAEESIKESEEKFSKVFKSSVIGFSIANLEHVRVEANDAMAKLLEATREQIIGKTRGESGTDILNAAFYEQQSRLTEKIKNEGFLNNEKVYRTLVSGKVITTLVSVELIEIKGVPHFLSAAIDITDKENAEKALKENEEKFAKAFSSNVIGKAILNKAKKIVEVNETLANIVGFKREDMLGCTVEEIGLFDLNNQENIENENKLWSQFNEKGYVSNIELKYLLQSGKELHILISLQTLQLNNEGHVMLTILDITEKKNAEAELKKYRNNLEELIEVRTEEVHLKNNQLERMNKLFVGRELKMKELKAIIKELQLKNDK